MPKDYGGLVEAGNIDLKRRPVVRLPDGSIATVRSLSFRNKKGEEVLVPTVREDGKIMTNEEAIQHYGKTGKHLGKFRSVKEANEYAVQLHKDQERMYVRQGIGEALRRRRGNAGR